MNTKGIIIVVVVLILAGLSWWFNKAEASRYHNTTNITNNYLENNYMTITNGASDEDLAAGLAAAFAAGNHQLDYGTYDWQGSIVGSWETGQDENAVSFALGKHFKGMDTLLHTSYTQSNSNHYVTFGGTFRF